MISAEAFLQRNPIALEERCRAEQGERNVDAESSHRFARRGMGAAADDPNDADACREAASVSYTHLTLPTKALV